MMISIADNIKKFGNCVYTVGKTLEYYWTTEEHFRLDKQTRNNLKNTVKRINRLNIVITSYHVINSKYDDNYKTYVKLYTLWKEIEETYIFKKLL